MTQRLDSAYRSLIRYAPAWGMRRHQGTVFVVENRRAPLALRLGIIPPYENRQVSNVSPSVSDQGIDLNFIEPLQGLLVWVLRKLAPTMICLAHAGLLSVDSARHAACRQQA
jgi:hypothetical protein